MVFVEVDEDTSAYDDGHIAGAVKLDWRTDLQDPVSTQPRHVRMEPARGIEPRPPPYQGGMLTVATKQA